MIHVYYQKNKFILTYFLKNKYKYVKKKYINLVIYMDHFLKIEEIIKYLGKKLKI